MPYDRTTSKERNIGLDLLKVIAIFMVIVLHYNNAYIGGILGNLSTGGANFHIAHFTESVCIIACNLFVLITGYHLSYNTKINVRKIIDIVFILFFYGIVIYVFALFNGNVSLSFWSLKAFFETVLNRWFIDLYIVLYILSPFINKMINELTKQHTKWLILVLICFFSVWPSFYTNVMVMDSGYGIVNFVILYLIGSYIKRYADDYSNIYVILSVYLICLLCTFFSSIIDENVTNRIFSEYICGKAFRYNYIFNIIESVAIFIAFKNLKLKSSSLVVYISGCSLSTYIIHENQFIAKWVYQDIFKTMAFYDSKYMIFHMLFTCFVILIICIIIETFRKWIFKNSIDKILRNSKTCNKSILI